MYRLDYKSNPRARPLQWRPGLRTSGEQSLKLSPEGLADDFTVHAPPEFLHDDAHERTERAHTPLTGKRLPFGDDAANDCFYIGLRYRGGYLRDGGIHPFFCRPGLFPRCPRKLGEEVGDRLFCSPPAINSGEEGEDLILAHPVDRHTVAGELPAGSKERPCSYGGADAGGDGRFKRR